MNHSHRCRVHPYKYMYSYSIVIQQCMDGDGTGRQDGITTDRMCPSIGGRRKRSEDTCLDGTYTYVYRDVEGRGREGRTHLP